MTTTTTTVPYYFIDGRVNPQVARDTNHDPTRTDHEWTPSWGDRYLTTYCAECDFEDLSKLVRERLNIGHRYRGGTFIVGFHFPSGNGSYCNSCTVSIIVDNYSDYSWDEGSDAYLDSDDYDFLYPVFDSDESEQGEWCEGCHELFLEGFIVLDDGSDAIGFQLTGKFKDRVQGLEDIPTELDNPKLKAINACWECLDNALGDSDSITERWNPIFDGESDDVIWKNVTSYESWAKEQGGTHICCDFGCGTILSTTDGDRPVQGTRLVHCPKRDCASVVSVDKNQRTLF